MKIKAASFNICHCEDVNTGKIDYDAFANAIKALDADIIGLNEVRDAGESEGYDAQVKILAEKTGYNCFFAKATEINGANPYGNAVLTRLKIKECEVIPIPDPDPRGYDDYYETRCVLRLALCEPDITVFITHFGLNPDEQQNAVNTVLSSVKGENVVFMGDLNVCPDSPVLDPIRQRLSDSADASDLPLLTFPSDKPDRKIDYIFTGSAISAVSTGVPDLILSDHRPITAMLEIDG